MLLFKIGCSMALLSTTTSVCATHKKPKVIVIGAGIAGLTTAYRLHQKEVDVEVYEARGRVGGRIFSVFGGGATVELGGQNIADGGEAKSLRRLLKECDLELLESKVDITQSYGTQEKFIPVRPLLRSKHFDPDTLREQLTQLASESNTMQEVLNGVLEEEDPLYKVMAVRLAAYEGAPIEKLSSLYTETLYHSLLGGIAAVHQWDEKKEEYVNFITIKGGNALLPERMAEVLGSRVHLHTPLERVAKDKDGVFVLTFKGGQTVTADLLVLAIPCSVYDTIVFEEQSIPLERLESIKSVHYGTNAKIVVPFSHVPVKRAGLINDRMGTFFDVATKSLTLYYIGAASFFSPKTLVATYNQDRPMLEKCFGNDYPPFVTPVYAEDQAFASYEGAVGYSWPNDPYAKGTYWYISPGQETLLTELQEEQGELVKALFAPIDSTLYFAGEHASILMKAPGTMEAACESGERTARMILRTHRESE